MLTLVVVLGCAKLPPVPQTGPRGEAWVAYNQSYAYVSVSVQSASTSSTRPGPGPQMQTRVTQTTTTTIVDGDVVLNEGSPTVPPDPPVCAGVGWVRDCPAFAAARPARLAASDSAAPQVVAEATPAADPVPSVRTPVVAHAEPPLAHGEPPRPGPFGGWDEIRRAIPVKRGSTRDELVALLGPASGDTGGADGRLWWDRGGGRVYVALASNGMRLLEITRVSGPGAARTLLGDAAASDLSYSLFGTTEADVVAALGAPSTTSGGLVWYAPPSSVGVSYVALYLDRGVVNGIRYAF